MKTLWNGMLTPENGDVILKSLEQSFSRAGTIRRVTSVAAAKVILEEAAASGVTISATTPAYFDVGGTLYVCAGAKNVSGEWVVAPVSQFPGFASQADAEDFLQTLADAGVTVTATTPVLYLRGDLGMVLAYDGVASRRIAGGVLNQRATDSLVSLWAAGQTATQVKMTLTLPYAATVNIFAQASIAGAEAAAFAGTLVCRYNGTDSPMTRFNSSSLYGSALLTPSGTYQLDLPAGESVIGVGAALDSASAKAKPVDQWTIQATYA